KPGIDFVADVTVPTKRVSIGNFGFQGGGVDDVSSFGLRGGGKRSSQDFLNALYQTPNTNIASLASDVRGALKLSRTNTVTTSTLSSSSVGAVPTQISQFEGLGLYERTGEVSVNIPGLRDQGSSLQFGQLSLQTQSIKSDSLGFSKSFFRPTFVETDSQSLFQTQISGKTSSLGKVQGLVQIPGLIQIPELVQGLVQIPGLIQVPELIQIPDLVQGQTSELDFGFTGTATGRGFDFGFIGSPGKGFGFIPGIPGLDLFETRPSRVGSKRTFRRNPSILALEYDLPRYSDLTESTALVARPFNSSRRKKKRKK
ncbi:MAG TPA: hypothetical protein VGA67_02365, partial [Candidatus Dojkabacteria bacterium]